MTWGLFFAGCFLLPVIIGAVLARFIALDNPEIKPFEPRMRINFMVFVLALAGVLFIVLSERVTLEKDWITPGGFLAVATINLSLGLVLARRKRKLGL